jgi:hypothetical protein
MSNIQFLIDSVRSFLIETGDNMSPNEIYLRFINDCKSLNLTEEQFYKDVLRPASKSIDWDTINKEKKEKEKAKLEEKERIEDAETDIARRIRIMFEDGIVEASELRIVFAKAAEFSMDVREVAKRIDALLNERGYKSYPKANMEAPGLVEMLTSTDWYSAEAYAERIKRNPPPPKPQPSQPQLSSQQPQPTSPIPPNSDVKKKPTRVFAFVVAALLLVPLIYMLTLSSKGGQGDNDDDYSGDTTSSPSPITSNTNEAPSQTNVSRESEEPVTPAITPDTTGGTYLSGNEEQAENIKNTLRAFYQFENDGDINSLLSYFAFPVSQYYAEKCPCDWSHLYNVYYKAYHETFTYHHITVDWSSFSYTEMEDGFEIRLKASYEFRKAAWPGDQPNKINYPSIIIYMNNDYKIVSVNQL